MFILRRTNLCGSLSIGNCPIICTLLCNGFCTVCSPGDRQKQMQCEFFLGRSDTRHPTLVQQHRVELRHCGQSSFSKETSYRMQRVDCWI
jgi:hypothetical protein